MPMYYLKISRHMFCIYCKMLVVYSDSTVSTYILNIGREFSLDNISNV